MSITYDHKQALLAQIELLYQDGDLFKVIDLLENNELDFELCLQLVRTYINVARQSGDPYTLLDKAQTLLDNFAKLGHDNAAFQFYQGCILFDKGLISDSAIRFEHGLKFVQAGDEKLLRHLLTYLEITKKLQKISEFKGCAQDQKEFLLDFYKTHFGEEILEFDRVSTVSLYVIKSNEKYDYNMLVTIGLSGKDQIDSEGNSSDFELCFPLVKDFSSNDLSHEPFEISMYKEIIENIIYQDNFIGFGYCFEREQSFSKLTAFNGVMLCSIGDHPIEEQSVNFQGRTINFLQMLPLRPMELNYRQSHSAFELLDLFKQKQQALTPFIKTRDDVCSNII